MSEETAVRQARAEERKRSIAAAIATIERRASAKLAQIERAQEKGWPREVVEDLQREHLELSVERKQLIPSWFDEHKNAAIALDAADASELARDELDGYRLELARVRALLRTEQAAHRETRRALATSGAEVAEARAQRDRFMADLAATRANAQTAERGAVAAHESSERMEYELTKMRAEVAKLKAILRQERAAAADAADRNMRPVRRRADGRLPGGGYQPIESSSERHPPKGGSGVRTLKEEQ